LLPLFFNGSIFSVPMLKKGIYGFLAFTFLASSIYILNDIQDIEKDRLHPKKKIGRLLAEQFLL